MQGKDNLSGHSSKDYDIQIYKTIPYYESFHTETLNLIRSISENHEIWLDTGCGTGTLVQRALEVFKNCRFILVDPSSEMMSLAEQKLSKHVNNGVMFLEPGETGEISLKNEKPDVITAIQAHHYLSVEGRVKATEKCYNMLKDNGIYVTFENVRPSTKEAFDIARNYWKNFQIDHGRSIETVENHLKRFDNEYFPITVDEHMSLLEKTGFQTFEVFWISYMQAGFYGIK